MTDKMRSLLKDVQTVYEGKGMIVHPNSFDRLRTEVVILDNINKQQSEQIEKMKCCENCKYHSFWGDELKCNYGLKEALQEDKFVECKNKDKWEIAND